MAYTLKLQDKEQFTQNRAFQAKVRNVLIDTAKDILKGTTSPTTLRNYKINSKLSQIAQSGIGEEQLAQLIRLLLTDVTQLGDAVAPGGVFDIKIAVESIADAAILTALQADFEVFAGVVPGDAATAYPAVEPTP